MKDWSQKAAQNLAAVRSQKPLVHNITNYVVMNFTANALLAIGASPVMAHAFDEVEEMVALAGALVLNIGTLRPDWVEAMIRAAQKANALGRSVVLDPVGAGATTLRTSAAKEILAKTKVAIVRGNASEVLALADPGVVTRGVDAVHGVDAAAQAAETLAQSLESTLAITGPVDRITDGIREVRVENGHPLLSSVTGTGCAATATIGAFAAVDNDPLSAAATALAFFGLAGETAARKASAPGSFATALVDALYTITPEDLQDNCRIAGTLG